MSPLEKGDHPGLDVTPFLNPDDIQKYQSLIGALQWAITIGRMDIYNILEASKSDLELTNRTTLDFL